MPSTLNVIKVRRKGYTENLLTVGVDVGTDELDLPAGRGWPSVNRYQNTTSITTVRPSTAAAWT